MVLSKHLLVNQAVEVDSACEHNNIAKQTMHTEFSTAAR